MNRLTLIQTALMVGSLVIAFPTLAQHDHRTGSGTHSQPHGDHGMRSASHGFHATSASAQPTKVGQDAFAAIQEVVAILEADPNTNWTQVDIDALRDHLVDMHLVTLYAQVQSDTIEGGARYQVTGEGDTVAAIKRMVTAHARQMSSDTGWHAQTTERADGVVLTVTAVTPADTVKIRGLGFSGFMAQGDHHRPHHLKMAKGEFTHHH